MGAPYACLTQARLDEWHAMGLSVGVWTVNEKMDIKTARDMGADMICTDFPARANALR